jgi:hypothetical protein
MQVEPSGAPAPTQATASRPLRVVQIAPFPLLPTWSGGKLRIVELARAVSKLGVEVTVITPYHLTQSRTLAEREPFALRQVPYVPFAVPFLFVDRPFPWGWLVSFHPGYRTLLPVSLADFDVCQIEHPAFVDLLRDVPRRVPVVYSAQNVELDYVSDECRSPAVRRIVRRRIHALESRLVERATHIFTCTDQDASRLSELYGSGKPFSILPNGIDVTSSAALPYVRAPVVPSSGLKRKAIFVGSNVEHNRGAVHTILTKIAPALERDVEFIVLGSCIRSFKEAVNVRLDETGDMARYAGPGAVGLNPVTTGSGSNMKILRYLTCSLPVLSTPFGMRGFEDLAPWVTVVGIDRFADALLAEPRSMDGASQQLANYEWDRIAEKAVRVYRTLAGRG